MSPEEFISRWRGRELKERQFYQSHFNELCRVLDVPDPISFARDADYCFEKAVPHTDGAAGFADVWKRDSFVWEYKGEAKNLTTALVQADRYARALANPPLLIVSDAQEIRVRTNFTNEVSVTRTYRLHDLATEASRRELRDCWIAPDRLRPTVTREAVTAKAAGAVGDVAARLRARKDAPDPRRIAHVMNRFVFCLFAEDIGVLPDQLFSEILEDCLNDPPRFAQATRGLFRAMKDRDGLFGSTRVPWVNGGLFDDDDVLDLDGLSIRDLFEASKLDWSAIEPSIFGTLFERGLDPGKRRAMAGAFDGPATPSAGAADRGPDRGVGIHYTDPDKIMKIVEPVVLRPLAAEWAEATARIAALRAKRDAAATDAARTRHEEAARALWWAFRERLGAFRVLDPACGSGNFLYMALVRLKDFDRAVQTEGRALDLPPDDERVGPQSVLGIEVNPYAAELARTTVWIGELQWQMRNTGPIRRAPVLGRLDGIECRDALLNADGTEAAWPRADAIVGNPPFLGTKRLIATLGEDYVARLRRAYDGRVPQEADLVAVWLARAAEGVAAGTVRTAGLVTTNSIRGGASRRVVARMLETATLYDAWADEEWAVEGAAVRVSLLCFARRGDPVTATVALDGAPADEVFADLTGRRAGSNSTADLTSATRIPENSEVAFQGPVLVGSFDVEYSKARSWLEEPINVNGRPNADVLRPLRNGKDINSRSRWYWVIDFYRMNEERAAQYEAVFKYTQEVIKVERSKNNDAWRRENWWLHGRSGDSFRNSIRSISRYIATSQVSKHRFFVWLSPIIQPHQTVIAIARDDDTTFGILHSRFHEAWSLRMGTSLEDRPRYTPTTCFETFPFPGGLTPDIPAAAYADDPRAVAIAAAARDLDEKREAWLNPPDLTMRVPEVVPGYPDRILPRNDRAAAILKKRTLTNLYNERPAWLDHLHRRLDAAVAAAYGWPADLPEADALARLFALNRERAAKTP